MTEQYVFVTRAISLGIAALCILVLVIIVATPDDDEKPLDPRWWL